MYVVCLDSVLLHFELRDFELRNHVLPLQHALRLSAFGQLHKVLGMDPLPSKMPRKPKSETPIDYTGLLSGPQKSIIQYEMLSVYFSGTDLLHFLVLVVQIPPSTTYAPPLKRPIEEEEGGEDKSPNKKKKKLQKKCNFVDLVL